MRQDEIDEMRRLPLFAHTRPDEADRLLRASYLQRLPAHVELVREGEPADFLHVVVEGQVEVFARYRDRETTVAVLRPHASFILAAVLTDRVYLKSARVLVPSRILLIPAERVRHAFETDVGFARVLTIELAEAYRDVVKELKNQKLRTSLERLAAWLLHADTEAGGRGSFDLPFEKKVLAARIGVAPEVLSRSFAALADYHVEVAGKSITIADRKALERLAGPNPLIDDPKA